MSECWCLGRGRALIHGEVKGLGVLSVQPAIFSQTCAGRRRGYCYWPVIRSYLQPSKIIWETEEAVAVEFKTHKIWDDDTSAEASDVTSIRFSARKANTAAANAGEEDPGKFRRVTDSVQKLHQLWYYINSQMLQILPATTSSESYPSIRSQRRRSWSVDRYPEKARTIHLKAIRNLHQKSHHFKLSILYTMTLKKSGFLILPQDGSIS